MQEGKKPLDFRNAAIKKEKPSSPGGLEYALLYSAGGRQSSGGKRPTCTVPAHLTSADSAPHEKAVVAQARGSSAGTWRARGPRRRPGLAPTQRRGAATGPGVGPAAYSGPHSPSVPRWRAAQAPGAPRTGRRRSSAGPAEGEAVEARARRGRWVPKETWGDGHKGSPGSSAPGRCWDQMRWHLRSPSEASWDKEVFQLGLFSW